MPEKYCAICHTAEKYLIQNNESFVCEDCIKKYYLPKPIVERDGIETPPLKKGLYLIGREDKKDGYVYLTKVKAEKQIYEWLSYPETIRDCIISSAFMQLEYSINLTIEIQCDGYRIAIRKHF